MAHARLLEIAIREFATKGLDGASTRSIAAAAGTAMSSITYHYGGKDGLYLAAADYIAKEMSDLIGDHGVELVLFTGEPDSARGAIKAILARMIDLLAGKESETWSLFITREQMHPTEAFDRIYAGPMGRLMGALVELVCVATGVGDREAARVAVLTLWGQVLMLRVGRATCAKLLERDPVNPGVIARYQQRIAANIDAILDAMTMNDGNRHE